MKFEGKTIIELTDAKSGKLVRRTEDKNMLTNALTKFYKQGGITNPSAFNVGAIRSDALHYLLGGVLLLDTALTEDADIIRVPTGVGMTANGVYNVLNSGNPTELGSWNETESGWQQDGSYKMVWDYTTSQGNGTIACVCLTSLYGGYRGAGNKSGTYKTNSYNMSAYNSFNNPSGTPDHTILGLYNNMRMALRKSQNTPFSNMTEWTIDKMALPLTEVDVRDNLSNRIVETVTVQIPSELQNLGAGYVYGSYTIKQIGSSAYIMMMPAETRGTYYTRYFHFSDSYPVYVVKYDMSNDTVTLVASLTPSTTGLAGFDLGGDEYPSNAVTNEYAVFAKYIFDLSNLANVVELTDFPMSGQNMYAIDGEICESNGYRVDMAEGVYAPVNPSSDAPYSLQNCAGLLGFDGTKVWRDPRYIATINNLEAPVTKTADKTMKVTYVIRFS